MAEIGKWCGHTFEVSPNIVRGFTGLTIKGSSETEDKEDGGWKYVSRKAGMPKEFTLDVFLASYLGCDVRAEALEFIEEAVAGKSGYFYVGTKKLMACQMMLTEASAKEVTISGSGVWTRATVSLTMKQCGKNDEQAASGGGGNRVSVSTTPPASSILQAVKNSVDIVVNAINKVQKVNSLVNAATTKINSAVSAVKNAVSAVKTTSTAAKTASAQAKTTLTKAYVQKKTASILGIPPKK